MPFNVRELIDEPGPCSPQVIDLSSAMVMTAITFSDTAKIRPQTDHPLCHECAGDGLGDFVIECPAEQGVRVCDYREPYNRAARRLIESCLE